MLHLLDIHTWADIGHLCDTMGKYVKQIEILHGVSSMQNLTDSGTESPERTISGMREMGTC